MTKQTEKLNSHGWIVSREISLSEAQEQDGKAIFRHDPITIFGLRE